MKSKGNVCESHISKGCTFKKIEICLRRLLNNLNYPRQYIVRVKTKIMKMITNAICVQRYQKSNQIHGMYRLSIANYLINLDRQK